MPEAGRGRASPAALGRRAAPSSARGRAGRGLALGALALVLVPAGAVTAPALARSRASASTCTDYSFPVYFHAGSAALDVGGKAAIAAAAHHYRRCEIERILVVSLSMPREGLALAEKRLRTVAAELEEKGLRHPTPEIAGAIMPRRAVMTEAAEVEITVARSER